MANKNTRTGFNPADNTLNGQPFIGTEVALADILHRPAEGTVPRKCSLCFYVKKHGKGCGGALDNGTHKEVAKNNSAIVGKKTCQE